MESIEKLERSLQNLNDKTCRIYLFVQDTKGNPKASVQQMYQIALTLKRNGFNSIILKEKEEYIGVGEWLGQEYMDELPHVAIEGQNLQISPEDFLIVPEIFGFVLDQVKNLPCAKIIMCQSYDYMLETIQPGFGWANYGFLKCITTSQFQKDYIETVMKNISVDIIEPFIPNYFEKSTLLPNPIIGVHSRDQRKTLNFIKTFYLKFPQYRWVSFRDLRGLSNKDFSNSIRECFLTVWIDETSGFGTFPLESMKCGVPVIGKVPNLFPHWMNESNGIWISDELKMIDITSDFLQNWLEDNIKPDLYEEMEKTVSELITEEGYQDKILSHFNSYIETRKESFETQLNKLKPIED